MSGEQQQGGRNGGGVGVAARLARKNILELQPYRCARDDYSTGILLDANENSYGPSVPVPTRNGNEGGDDDDANVVISGDLNRYPDPYQIPLKEKFLKYRAEQLLKLHGGGALRKRLESLRPENVFVGVGSDEAIDLLMRVFCVPSRDEILQTPPTYGMYKVCAKVNDVAVRNVPLTPSFDVVVRDIIDAVTPSVKLVFICSPGNPTSKVIPVRDVIEIADHPKVRQNSLVVVDEAYVDFCSTAAGASGDDENGVSAISLVNEYPNVVVLQTLSKAFGLAAIRCGFCVAAPDVVQLLNNVKAPYNVNELTSQYALRALDDASILALRDKMDRILEQRDYLAGELSKLDFVVEVFPSDSNFILFRLRDRAQDVYKNMADKCGVVTRFRGNELHCSNCIRVTVGTPDENRAFLGAMKQIYQELSSSSSG